MRVSETAADASLRAIDAGSHNAVEAEALTRLFLTYARTTHRFLIRLGVASGDVDDVLQQVFMLVWRKLDALRPDASERAWVLAIAKRCAANHRRKHHREPPRSVQAAPVTPEEHASGREAARLVREFLERLDEPRRVAFHLADVEGLTVPEIAEIEGTNVNTIYTRLRAARRAFREFVATRTERGEDD